MTEQQSRMARKKAAIQTTEEKREGKAQRKRKKTRKPRVRLIPIWLRLILFVVLTGGSLLLGLIVGFGVIGDGDPSDALKTETWYHIIDIIQGK